jgi:hypothetical protein
VDFCFPLEPSGREEQKSGWEQKSANVERKTVTLIYPYSFIIASMGYKKVFLISFFKRRKKEIS